MFTNKEESCRMTFMHVYVLSAICYILISLLTIGIAHWIVKKKQGKLKLVEAGLIQLLGCGFVLALILGSLTAGYNGIWAPTIAFAGWMLPWIWITIRIGSRNQ